MAKLRENKLARENQGKENKRMNWGWCERKLKLKIGVETNPITTKRKWAGPTQSWAGVNCPKHSLINAVFFSTIFLGDRRHVPFIKIIMLWERGVLSNSYKSGGGGGHRSTWKEKLFMVRLRWKPGLQTCPKPTEYLCDPKWCHCRYDTIPHPQGLEWGKWDTKA